jgi:hypothetical protein
MSEQAHGQYYAQELVLDATRSARERIQEALDNGAAQNWTLIGASDVPASGGTGASGVGGTTVGDAEASAERGTSGRAVILFWDTQRPSFARSTG